MKYRAYCYLGEYRNDPQAIRLTSEPVYTRQEAEELLDRLTALPGITGGDIEVEAGRLGWVLESEAESSQIIMRRREGI